jgi:hypothetical protein
VISHPDNCNPYYPSQNVTLVHTYLATQQGRAYGLAVLVDYKAKARVFLRQLDLRTDQYA